jgi:hypothetical protein
MLVSGNRASGSNTGLVWARTIGNLGNFSVVDFVLSEFGERWWKIREKSPKFVSRLNF